MSETKPEKKSDKKKPQADGAALVKRMEALKTKRDLVVPYWQKAYDNTYPLRGELLGSSGLTGPEALGSASSKNARTYDSTLRRSVRMLASALFSGLTPANSRWFSQTVLNVKDEGAKKWLDESSNTIWLNIHNCNFDTAGYEAFIDYVIAGMFVMYIEDGDLEEGKLYNFSLWPLTGCYFADSTGKGVIDTVFRVRKFTAEQAVKEFGDACSAEVQKNATERPDELVEVMHCIYPRPAAAVKSGKVTVTLPIASDHVEVKTKKILRESGYWEMPVVVPRWMPIPESVYSLGIVDDALPDFQTLNELVKYVLSNADLAIAGMWGALDDGVVNPKTVKVGPRKIIPMATKDSFFPLQPAGRFDVAALEKSELQSQIKSTMLSDQLHPENGPQMTATEVHMRAQIVRQLLGPMYGRLQSEYMVQVVNRCFGIAYRAGVLGEAPEIIHGKVSQLSFQSPLARAQKLDDVAAMERHEAALLNQAQIGMPNVLDTYDWDEAAKERADLLGVPTKMIRDEKEILKLRQARAEAAAKVQQAAAKQERDTKMMEMAGRA